MTPRTAVLLLLLVGAGSVASADAAAPAPDSRLLTAPPQYRLETTGPVQIAAGWWFSAYRGSISKVRGPVCNFEPSCSHYSQEAIRDYGLLRGLIMTGERLQRCHPCLEGHHYRRGAEPKGGAVGIVDPPGDHDVWWWWTGHRDRPESGWLSVP